MKSRYDYLRKRLHKRVVRGMQLRDLQLVRLEMYGVDCGDLPAFFKTQVKIVENDVIIEILEEFINVENA